MTGNDWIAYSDRCDGIEVVPRIVLTASPIATEKYITSKCDAVLSTASTKQPSLELSRNNMPAGMAVESVKHVHHRACWVDSPSSPYDNLYIKEKGKNALRP
jgi:hypothetical protein